MQLPDIYDLVGSELEETRSLLRQLLGSEVPAVAGIFSQIDICGGKLLRPALVFLSGKVCGDVCRKHIAIAAVLEMVHAATLVHDDVLDEAGQRRYHRTINSLHGNEAAVLMGDLLFSRAFHLCSSLDCQITSQRIAATANTICEGELMQLFHRGRYDLSEAQYLEIVSRKTASLMAVCCYLGAKVAQAQEKICVALESFGHTLGIAFQIMDDITDLAGNEKASGKTLGTDLAKEKFTLPCIHYLRHCGPEEILEFQELLSNPNGSTNNILFDRLNQTDSIDYAYRRAGYYSRIAQESLSVLPQTDLRQGLIRLAQGMVSSARQDCCK